MAILYLHIGTPKTGTSAIQHTLSSNKELLDQQNVVFPDFELRYGSVSKGRNAHFLIEKDDPEKKDYAHALNKIIELSKRYDKIVISEENLWRQSERLLMFRDDLKMHGIQMKIIVYFRRQDLYLQSQYAQHVKIYLRDTFEEYAETQNLLLDYYSHVHVLSEQFGKENMIVRVYEKQQFLNQDLISDFFEQVGIRNREMFTGSKDVNISLGGIYLETKRLLNRNAAFQSKDNFVVRYLKEAAAKAGKTARFSSNQYFSDEKQKMFLAQFEESNQKVAKEFLGRENGILFMDLIASEKGSEQETETSEAYAKLAAFVKENNLENEICRYVEEMNQDTYAARYKKEECVDVLAEVILMQQESIDGQKQKIQAQKERIAKLLTPKESVKNILRYGRDQVKGAFMSGKKKEK